MAAVKGAIADPYKGLPFGQQVALAIKNAPRYRMSSSQARKPMDFLHRGQRRTNISETELDVIQVGKLGGVGTDGGKN